MGKKERNDNLDIEQIEYIEMKKAKRKQKRLDKEEKEICKREARKKRHYKKLERKARFRPLKNFLWWFCGFCSFIVIVGGAIFGTLYFVKVKDVLGGDSKQYVSDEIANKSLLNAGLGYESYTIGEIPAIKMLVDSISENVGLNKYITIDFDKLNKTKLFSSDIVDSLNDCIEITATLSSSGAVEYLGELGDLNIFKNYDLVPEESLPDESSTDFNCELYYYKKDDESYARAFDNNHKRVIGAEEKPLYYPALQDIAILGLGNVLNDRFETEKVKSLLETFGVENDSSFYDIIGDKTIKDMQSFDINEMELTSVISNDFEEDGITRQNAKLYTIIKDISSQKILSSVMENHNNQPENESNQWTLVEAEEYFNGLDEVEQNSLITVGCLADADVNLIRLTNVMPMTAENASLFKILRDMTGNAVSLDDIVLYNGLTDITEYNNATTEKKAEYLEKAELEKSKLITIGSLSGANISDIKLTSVLGTENENKILDKLLKKDSTVGNIGTTLNEMSLAEVFEVKVFATQQEIDEFNVGKEESQKMVKIDFLDDKNVFYQKVVSLVDGEEVITYQIPTGSLAENEKYYITDKASIWLLMLYDCSDINEDGFGKLYTENKETTKIANMDLLVASMTTKMKTATIRQLVSCGILNPNANFGEREIDPSTSIYLYAKNLQDAIGAGIS